MKALALMLIVGLMLAPLIGVAIAAFLLGRWSAPRPSVEVPQEQQPDLVPDQRTTPLSVDVHIGGQRLAELMSRRLHRSH